jgi:hypothetical protein
MTQDSLSITLGATCSEPIDLLLNRDARKGPVIDLTTKIELQGDLKLTGTVDKTGESLAFDTFDSEDWKPGTSVATSTFHDGTVIDWISSDGKEMGFSRNGVPLKLPKDERVTITRKDAGINVFLSRDVMLHGTFLEGNTRIKFDEDVRDYDWQTKSRVEVIYEGLQTTETGNTVIAQKNTGPLSISWISPDGRIIELDETKSSFVPTGSDVFVRHTTEYRMKITPSHNLMEKKPGTFTTLGEMTAIDQGATSAIGTIQGSGYELENGKYWMRLNVTSGATGLVVGQVWLEGDASGYGSGQTYSAADDPNSIKISHFPTGLVGQLNNLTATASYWHSIQSCDITTAQQKQNAVDAIANQNQFQTFFRP